MKIKLHGTCSSLYAVATAMSLGATIPANAATFTLGEIDGQFDSYLSLGVSWAARGPDSAFIGALNGGDASANASDDGRLNFRKGEVFSNTFKGVHDLELKYRDTGVFVRGRYWYDFELKDGHQHLYDIDDSSRDAAAKSSGIGLLDAFIYHNYHIGARQGSARLGKQVVNWGESTFIGNSINSVNPIDVAAFRRPGAELKEGLIPVNLVYLSQNLSDNTSVELFYQLEWDKTVLDNCGTFFASDIIATGCDDRLEAPMPIFGHTYLPRAADRDARDSGQFGVALRWYAAALNDTEFGLYALNYHSRSPYMSGASPDASALPGSLAIPGKPGLDGQPRQASTGRYFFDYPEDIRLYGLSFSTILGSTAVQGEVSHRPNMPMQINGIDISTAAFYGPMAAMLGSPIHASGHASPESGQAFKGYVRKPFTQLQVTATHFFDQIWGADRLSLIGEAGASHIDHLNDSALRFGRDAVYGNGEMPAAINPLDGQPLDTNQACTLLLNTANPDRCNNKGFYTSSSWGYRARAVLEYSNLIANVTLRPSLAWAHDVRGFGPTFNEGNKAISLGLEADYRNAYTASFSYTDFFGGDYNTNTDRDFFAFSVGVSF